MILEKKWIFWFLFQNELGFHFWRFYDLKIDLNLSFFWELISLSLEKTFHFLTVAIILHSDLKLRIPFMFNPRQIRVPILCHQKILKNRDNHYHWKHIFFEVFIPKIVYFLNEIYKKRSMCFWLKLADFFFWYVILTTYKIILFLIHRLLEDCQLGCLYEKL